jgi:shikimate kinase
LIHRFSSIKKKLKYFYESLDILAHRTTSINFTNTKFSMRIFLIGYMGCGKSSTGKRLARLLDIPFYDTDAEIEEQQGKTIAQLFEEQGESQFRTIEKEYLLELQLANKAGVFATGGGMPCFHENMNLLNQMGITLYLERPVKELVNRLENSKKVRPLIAGKSPVELSEFITKQLALRESFYKQANFTVDRTEQEINNLMNMIKTKAYTQETALLDYKNEAFTTFLDGIEGVGTPLEQLLKTYEKVRDHFLYDPYHLDLRHEGLKASNILSKRRAWCVEKSNVMAACSRRLGFPTRLGYAIVTNHIGVERLVSYLRREEIVFHGYVDIYINGKWVSCTPSFDKYMCKMTGVVPLDFDGENDSLFQAFKGEDQFMEYLHYYGDFADVPIELMNSEMKKYYPHLFEKVYDERSFSFKHL